MSLPRTLLRALPLCLALAFAAQATGVAEALAGCSAACPGDDDEGQCPPSCAACLCAAPRVPVLQAFVVEAPPALVIEPRALVWRVRQMPADPGPSDIMHVPRALA